MLGKKIAVGFGIATILPCLIYYGVSTVSPRPNWEDYRVSGFYQQRDEVSQAERRKLEQERREKERLRKAHQHRFERHLYYVSFPLGVIAILYGTFCAVQAVGAGLIFGGIFSISNGCFHYWSQLDDVLRFVSLLVAFGLLIILGFRKLGDNGTGRPNKEKCS